jgi:hypothetical protein
MAVKPIGPETLYDSLTVVFTPAKSSASGVKPTDNEPAGGKPDAPKPDPGKPAKPAGGKPRAGPGDQRDEFVRHFRGQGGADPGELAHGIPQFLRRMNGELFNAPAPIVDHLAAERVSPERAIETLFLAALARRPMAEEQSIMAKYVAGRPTPEAGYSGVLWVLLNSGEFVLNR